MCSRIVDVIIVQQMKIYEDVFTNDEVFSDSFKMDLVFNDAGFEIQSKNLKKKKE